MKKILIHSIGAYNNNLFKTNNRDNYNRPYIYLKDKLAEIGYELITSDNNTLENVDYVFFNDYNSVEIYKGFRGKLKYALSFFIKKYKIRNLYKEILNSNITPFLFLWEAPAVMPENWNLELHNKFNIIFTWNDKFIDNKKYFKIYWPQTDIFPDIEKFSFSEKKLLVNISMNKNSKHRNELYSERLLSIKYFEKNYFDQFDLYGYGWTIKDFNSYKGTVKNKWDVMPKYKFALCYENISDESGLITEKIFDCFRCNCVPIYWGALNVQDFIPKNTFIDRRLFNNNEELAYFINNISEKEYNDYLNNINNFLKSNSFYQFLPENYFNILKQHLNK